MKIINYITIFFSIIIIINGCKVKSESAEETYFETAETEALFDLSFTKAERDSMQANLKSWHNGVVELHKYHLENSVHPSIVQNPFPYGFNIPQKQEPIDFDIENNVSLPDSDVEIAFLSVAELSILIRNKELTSRKLTEIYLSRLKKYSDTLECVVTLLEDDALAMADQMDQEISQGKYRGPLHGIPYGVKDLFSLPGYPTSWGAMPYKDQQLENTATVIKKLNEAGAVLTAKLTLGALAMGDVWYGGKTRNPWNLEQGSSGSSAGSGSATAAGLVAFAIGTETLGSIVSPSTRNGVTGLRPTFGRVSRAGGMALSWTMDKAGPMCRSAQDCAIVLDAIRGYDGIDPSAIDAAFNYNGKTDIRSLKVAYLKNLFEAEYDNSENDQKSLEVFRKMGVEMEEISLPDDIPYRSLRIILAAEAAAAFDELTRSNEDDLLVRQDEGAWPNYFRSSRFISAVDYINANRVRTIMIDKIYNLFKDYDAIITPTYGGPQLLATNLTGNPAVCIPNGFNTKNSPTSFTILGNLFDEASILLLAREYQNNTDFDENHPELFYK